jgi:hypothetical protein
MKYILPLFLIFMSVEANAADLQAQETVSTSTTTPWVYIPRNHDVNIGVATSVTAVSYTVQTQILGDGSLTPSVLDLTSVQNDEYMGSITGPVEAIRLNVSDLTGTSPTVTLDVRSRPIR